MNDTSGKTGVQVIHIVPPAEGELPEKKGSKTSVAYYNADGSYGYPQITITQAHIQVSWRVTGGGQIRHTWLEGTPTGSGGSYHLNQGDNVVAPGTYYHNLDGVLINTGQGGSMESTISYD